MNHRPTYVSHGLAFESEIPLGKSPISASDAVDVTIRSGRVEAFASESGVPWSASREDTVIRIEGVAAYHIKMGREIVVDSSEGATAADVGLFLRGTPLAALLMQRGYLPLHGSAVDTPEGAILFIGRTGSGKSALAACLEKQGFPLLSDELVAVQDRDGKPWIVGAGHHQWLWADVLRHLGYDPAQLAPLRPGLHRFEVQAENFQPQTRPVRAVFLLANLPNQEVQIEPLECDLALDAILSLTSRWRCMDLGGHQAQRLHLAKLVANLGNNWKVHFPRNLTRLTDLAQSVVARWEEPPTPHKPVKSGYVWLASYPKSGNTWVRALFTAWRYGLKEANSLASLEKWQGLTERHMFEEVMGVDSGLLNNEELLKWRHRFHLQKASHLSRQTVIKVHDLFDRSRDGEALFPAGASVGAIYVIRCPLDVAISFSHHFHVDIDRAIYRMGEPDSWLNVPNGGIGEMMPQRMSTWSEHVLSWVDQTDYPVLLVRYEDLLSDTYKELNRILAFLNLEGTEEKARQAIELTSFNALQEEERKRGFKERPANTKAFFRQGQAGQWREVLTPAQARKIATDHEAVMRRFGYGAEADEALAL